MTEIADPTILRLRAGLDNAAASIQVRPDLMVAVDSRRRRRARRRLAVAAATSAAALSVAAVVALTATPSSKTAKVVVGSPAAPVAGVKLPMGPAEAAPVGPPWWLPAPGTASRIEINNQTTDPIYQQLYLGSGSVNPAELLIATVDARRGTPSSAYIPSGTIPGESTIQVGSAVAHLANGGVAEQLWWTDRDGVQVIAYETGITPKQFVELMSRATPATGSVLGMGLPAALPYGLAPFRAGMSTHTGWVEDVQIVAGSCQGELDIYQGVPYLPSAVGGMLTRTAVGDSPALLQSRPGVGTALFWFNAPGLTAVLMTNGASGPSCAAPLLAPAVHRASSAEWTAERTLLGSHFYQIQPERSVPSTTVLAVRQGIQAPADFVTSRP